jgi:hypothetical protein
MSPRKQIALDVLARAKDCDDAIVIAACRRIIWADTLGWRKHGNRTDLEMVYEFYQM